MNKYEFGWISKNVHVLCYVLHFVLKDNHNFKTFQNMFIIWRFIFFYYKLQLCWYIINILPHLHVVKDYGYFNILIFKKLKIVSGFWVWHKIKSPIVQVWTVDLLMLCWDLRLKQCRHIKMFRNLNNRMSIILYNHYLSNNLE